jgi:hypothetical protein
MPFRFLRLVASGLGEEANSKPDRGDAGDSLPRRAPPRRIVVSSAAFLEPQRGPTMHSGPRGAVYLSKLALVAWIGSGAAAPISASAGAEAGDLAQVAEGDTPAPPQAENGPFGEEIAPPPAQEDEEEDQGQVDEGCLFMERPLELIV